jgi:hypothetical protein
MTRRSISRHARRPIVTPIAMLILGASAITGCGVPSDQGVRITDPSNVPFGLLETIPSPTAPAESTPDRPMDSFGTYFVRNGQLSEVSSEASSPVSPDSAMKTLLAGPDANSVRLGLRTALVGDRLVRSSAVSGGTAVVDLGEDFSALAPREQLLGLGQIVLTLTTLRGIGSVDFSVLGKRAEVRVGDGSLTPGPVTRDDYLSLIQP